MTALSGGQAARAGLASLLLSRYDVFLLDEPTNDLDLDGLDRLERFVTGLRAGVVVVSHDREFLARTVTRVVELDLAQQQVGVYGGGYDAYLEEREVARRHAREEYEEYAERRRRPRRTAPGCSATGWTRASATRSARRKDNDKIGRARARGLDREAGREGAADRAAASSGSRWSRSRARSGSCGWRSPPPRAPAPSWRPLRGAVVRRGAFTLGPVDLQVDWADRVAITGPNGSGKSTLLAALLGRLALDEGAVDLGLVAWSSARSTRPGRCSSAREPLLDAFARAGAGVARRGGPDAAGQVRARVRRTSTARRRRCRPASAPGPRWRCCRPAG